MQGLRSLIEKVNLAESNRQAETFRFVEEQKIKKALGPVLWEELKRTLVEFCSEINKSRPPKLIFENDGIYEVNIVNPKSGKSASLSYNEDVPCVFYKTPARQGQMVFVVSTDGNSVQFAIDSIARPLEEISTNIIRQVLP